MSSTKARLLDEGAELFALQGVYGTGLKQLIAAADAPFGSLYHHFPGGKSELAAAAVRHGGAHYERIVAAFYDADSDPVVATRRCFAGAADTLRRTGFAVACPIATVALETCSTDEHVRTACHEVFERWTVGLAQRLEAAGVERGRARTTSLVVLSLLEGGFLFSQTARTTEAIEAAGEAAVAAVQGACITGSDREPVETGEAPVGIAGAGDVEEARAALPAPAGSE